MIAELMMKPCTLEARFVAIVFKIKKKTVKIQAE